MILNQNKTNYAPIVYDLKKRYLPIFTYSSKYIKTDLDVEFKYGIPPVCYQLGCCHDSSLKEVYFRPYTLQELLQGNLYTAEKYTLIREFNIGYLSILNKENKGYLRFYGHFHDQNHLLLFFEKYLTDFLVTKLEFDFKSI